MAELVRGFLSSDEVATLRAIAAGAVTWHAGRQHTGYDTFALRLPDHAAAQPALVGSPGRASSHGRPTSQGAASEASKEASFAPSEVASPRARTLYGPRRRSWQPDRQEVSELRSTPLGSPRQLAAIVRGPIDRALALLGVPFDELWDVYLIRYPDGAHIPEHLDPAQHGRRHRRINAMVAPPISGGELVIAGARFELAVGDAVVFEPDRELHCVTPVVGTRLVFSVGAWV
jgi:2OG-Fe(II) oxygenase superfamily